MFLTRQSLIRSLKSQCHISLMRKSPSVVHSVIRLKSTEAVNHEKEPSLIAQMYPINKEDITENDLDEWLTALQKLKNTNAVAETETETYLSEFTHSNTFLEEKFEPTDEQVMELEAFKEKAIPLMYNTTVDNLVNLIMRDGKKSKAQNIVFRALYMVYLKTRKNPVEVLEITLDNLGPLMATKVEKTGNAKNRTVPYPLKKKQRNRYAITWILEGADKKKSSDFSVRLAEEIISSFEGKSSGYDKKAQMHKTAMAHRAYIRL